MSSPLPSWPLGWLLILDRETSESEVYARVLYSGRTLETIHGPLEWIPVSKLVEILEPFIPEDIVKLCS